MVLFILALLVGCSNTQYKEYHSSSESYAGKGGARELVDDFEIWSNGEPPRTFKVIGILEDERPGGVISMRRLKGDMVKKARENGGDALIELGNSSVTSGYYNSGSATAYSIGNTTNAYGSSVAVPIRRNYSSFAVIKYLD
ncbi:MAG: hypothetical protein IBX55_16610 [Methyloprofundus sp.]|nr:hypothetical protein [Methyloprofundus sp.]